MHKIIQIYNRKNTQIFLYSLLGLIFLMQAVNRSYLENIWLESFYFLLIGTNKTEIKMLWGTYDFIPRGLGIFLGIFYSLSVVCMCNLKNLKIKFPLLVILPLTYLPFLVILGRDYPERVAINFWFMVTTFIFYLLMYHFIRFKYKFGAGILICVFILINFIGTYFCDRYWFWVYVYNYTSSQSEISPIKGGPLKFSDWEIQWDR